MQHSWSVLSDLQALVYKQETRNLTLHSAMPRAVLNFLFLVCKFVLVNPDNALQECCNLNNSWDNILTATGLNKNSSTENVLQHILQHFWSTIGSTMENRTMETDYPKTEPDFMELSAISYHAGWAIKRARDIIKQASEEQLRLQNATNTKHFYHIEKFRALEVIFNLGEDEK